MKLWKKLSLLMAAVLLLSSGISCAAVISRLMEYNETRAVENYEQQLKATAYALGRELEGNSLLGYGAVTKNAYYQFLMRKYDDSRYILLGQDGVLCNQTAYELVDAQKERWSGSEAEKAVQQIGEKRLLILGKRIPVDSPQEYRLLLVQDISDVYGQFKEQIPVFAAGYLAAALAAAVLLFFLTRHMLTPLARLKSTAEQISEGKLSCRAEGYGRDEIGAVAEAFNRMAERVERQMEELEAEAERRMQLLGSLTHELKTPMTSIIGYSDTLLHVRLEEEQKRRALVHIHEECRRLERLSAKMMSLIGLYENDSIHPEEVEIAALFEKVAGLEAWQLEKKGMRLEVSCGLNKKCVDVDLFESLLVNLIDNAIKAGKEGDCIYLTGETYARPDGKPGERITVRDTGKGIPPEEIPKVTEAFYMVDKSRSRKEGGAGLGLSLCSRIAQLHGVKLSIESEVGKGTSVHLDFGQGSDERGMFA